MNKRGTDLGGSPSEWNDAVTLAAQERYLVCQGEDPTPHLERLRELTEELSSGAFRVACVHLLDLLDRYLAALAEGTPLVADLKLEIESTDLPASH